MGRGCKAAPNDFEDAVLILPSDEPRAAVLKAAE